MAEVVTHRQITQEILEKHGVTTPDEFASVGYQSECMCELYLHFEREMPVGIAKARTGDPSQWIFDRVCSIMGW